MNERIKELAEQAGCKVMDGEWYIPSATGLEKIVYTKGIGLEKFAELIVNECAQVADAERPSSLGCGYITKTIGIRIKEHFEVE